MAFSPEVKRLGREADHSFPSSAKVRKAWRYMSTPPILLLGVVRIQAQGRICLLLHSYVLDSLHIVIYTVLKNISSNILGKFIIHLFCKKPLKCISRGHIQAILTKITFDHQNLAQSTNIQFCRYSFTSLYDEPREQTDRQRPPHYALLLCT